VPLPIFNDSINQWQLEVLRDFDSSFWRFALLNWHRRARKSTLAINLLIRECTRYPKRRYGYITSTYTAAKNIIWRDPQMLKRYLPESLVVRTNESELYVEFTNGSILSIHGSDKPDSLRGVDFSGVVMDEFALIKPMVWEEIIRPIIAQSSDRWAMFTFTPKGRNHAFKYWTRAKDEIGWRRYELKGEQSLIIPREELDALKKEIPARTYAQEIQCFPKGTDIITADAVKDISEIVVGDFVLTHSGRFRKVLRTHCRQYEGDMLKVSSYGNPRDIISTPEHPFRVFKNKKCHHWVNAQDLNLKDRLVFPRILKGNYKIISEGLTKLLAWFISEGSFSKSNVCFSLNINESLERDEIVGILKEITNKRIQEYIANGSRTITITDCELGEFLVKHCGSGAKNKKIPFSLIKGHEELFYNTLILGDGCKVTEQRDTYVTVSRSLAYQVQLLAHCIGYKSGFCIQIKRPSNIRGRVIKGGGEYYTVRIEKSENKKHLKIQRHKYNISAPINKIEKIQYSGLVYNFEVQNDNSYTANGRSVHNCEFNEDSAGVFRGVDNCVHGSLKGKELGLTYVTGVDLAKSEDYTVVLTICRETHEVVAMQRFNQIDWSVQKEHIIGETKKYNSMAVVDATGLGDPIVEDLIKSGVNVLPYHLTSPSKKELIDRLVIAIEQRLITFPNIEVLIDELKNYTYEILPSRNLRYTAPEGMHDDCVIALALAVYGMRNFMYGKRIETKPRRRLQGSMIDNAGVSFASA